MQILPSMPHPQIEANQALSARADKNSEAAAKQAVADIMSSKGNGGINDTIDTNAVPGISAADVLREEVPRPLMPETISVPERRKVETDIFA